MSTSPRDSRRSWTPLVPSVAAGALWLVVAWVRWAFLDIPSGVAQIGNLIPAVIPPTVRTWPAPWPALALVMSALAVIASHALFSRLAITGKGGRAATESGAGRRDAHAAPANDRHAANPVIGAWFATIAAGATVGLALDVAVVWDSLAMFGPRGLIVGEFGAAAAAGALWGLVAGWMPGLLAGRALRSVEPSRRLAGWLVVAAGLAVVATIGATVAGADERRADIAAQNQARLEAEAETSWGAPPDPAAQGEPVPASAPATGPLDPQWCTADRAMLLKGEPDAATGHRGLAIMLSNFSDEPCVIEGYPDVAFGDQNAHLLAAVVEQGGSFMAQDPGPARIELPAGGSAVTYLGWDAAPPHGALVTKTVYAAPTAGMERGSWPIDLDIIEGSTVKVTAWQLGAAPGQY
ncbi:DUF4232 domain-containing protein [Microbacterium arthrosphaerae]|uniref:DUF4232 domain-containing protein n=1 Tax=Microbacterium arthrosphaerae TaxID=792652 RepID=UPI0035E57CA8